MYEKLTHTWILQIKTWVIMLITIYYIYYISNHQFKTFSLLNFRFDGYWFLGRYPFYIANIHFVIVLKNWYEVESKDKTEIYLKVYHFGICYFEWKLMRHCMLGLNLKIFFSFWYQPCLLAFEINHANNGLKKVLSKDLSCRKLVSLSIVLYKKFYFYRLFYS